MELIFNLIWLVLSFVLLAFWLIRRSSWTSARLRPSSRMQLLALAMLILILLPVVSLTDDLQACATPAEVEHIMRRGDLHNGGGNPLLASTLAVAVQIWFNEEPKATTVARLSPTREIGSPSEQYLRIIGNRPPPAA